MKNIPHRDAQGRFIHYCMAEKETCSAWGSFGFNHGKFWLCSRHKNEAENAKTLDISRETFLEGPSSGQGRLL